MSPEIMVVQLTSFDSYLDWEDKRATRGRSMSRPPSEYNEIMKSEERRDPAKFRVERRGQWAEVLDQYLYGPHVDRLFKPIPAFEKWPDDWYDRVDLSEDKGGPDPADVRSLAPTDGIVRWTYRAHLDPARSNHRCVLVIGHTEPFLHLTEDERGREAWRPYDHVIIDLIKAWDPVDYEDHTLPYEEITAEIAQLCSRYFTLREFTTDQYGYMLLPLLRMYLRRMKEPPLVREIDTNQASKTRRWERVKTALALNWTHSFRDTLWEPLQSLDEDEEQEGRSLLEIELRYLQRKGNTIGPPTIGDVVTDDCYDPETEVLTEHGWKLFKDVVDGERVATRSPDGVLEYQLPSRRVERRQQRGLYVYEKRHLNFAVTPTHRMLAFRKDTVDRSLRFVTPQEMVGRWQRLAEGGARRRRYPSGVWYVPKTAAVEAVGERVFELPAPLAPTPVQWSPPPPDGQCACGCGGLTEVAPKTYARLGWRKGERRKYLSHHGPAWTRDEMDYLEAHYADARMADLLAVLGRSRDAIYLQAREMGLRRAGLDKWRSDRPPRLRPVKLRDFAAFLGIWLSEGKKIRLREADGTRVSVTQTKPRGIEWIDGLFGRLGWPVVRSVRSNGETQWVVKSRELQEYLFALQNGHELRIPDEAFTDWGREALESLLEGLLVGDGSFSEKQGRYTCYSSSSKRLVDDVQRLMAHVGLAGAVRRADEAGREVVIRGQQVHRKHDQWQVNIDLRSSGGIVAKDMRRVPYDGPVYCLTVSNGTLLVRRGGVPMWSGNCADARSATSCPSS